MNEEQLKNYREYLLLLEFISYKQTKEIIYLLKQKTESLQSFTDLQLATLLGYVIERDDPELCRFAFEMSIFQKAKLGRDENSLNILHVAAEHASANTLETIISSLTDEETKALCWQIDRKGNLPLSKLKDNKKCSDEDYETMLSILVDHTQTITLIPLTQPLDFEEIKKEFAEQIAENPVLEKNLEIGTIVANSVRRKIKHSSSHTNCEDPVDIRYTIKNLRKELDAKTNKIKRSTLNVYLENLVRLTSVYEAANCMELSYLGADALFKMEVEEPFRIVHFVNGDHYYLVYPEPEGSIQDFINAQNSVAIDIWRGTVYPLKLSDSILTCYLTPEKYRIIFPYDNKYHRLSPLKFEFNSKFFAHSYTSTGKNFTPLEETRIKALLGKQEHDQSLSPGKGPKK